MLHSRPGFATRKNDTAPAKLNQDMIPALYRKQPKAAKPSTLAERLEEHKHSHAVPAEVLREAPEIIVNPLTIDPPHINEPGK